MKNGSKWQLIVEIKDNQMMKNDSTVLHIIHVRCLSCSDLLLFSSWPQFSSAMYYNGSALTQQNKPSVRSVMTLTSWGHIRPLYYHTDSSAMWPRMPFACNAIWSPLSGSWLARRPPRAWLILRRGTYVEANVHPFMTGKVAAGWG